MALSKTDVMNVLNDPILARMDFWVESLHVCQDSYRYVAKLIDGDYIHIAPGASGSAVNAFYHDDTDTLDTQTVDPPPDLEARALLLHECTHGFIDAMNFDITRLTEETGCYLAQYTYVLLKNPAFVVPPNNPPWLHFFQQVVELIKQFKLHEARGRGARLYLNDADFAALRTELNHLNLYASLKDDQRSAANGVPYPLPDDPAGGGVRVSSQDDSFVQIRLQGDLLFDFDKADVKPAADKLLQHAAVLVQKSSPRLVYINGYTDSVGDDSYNMRLSQRRADAVARWFFTHGLLPYSVMRPSGFGKAPGGAPVADAAGRANNRHVEIWVSKA